MLEESPVGENILTYQTWYPIYINTFILHHYFNSPTRNCYVAYSYLILSYMTLCSIKESPGMQKILEHKHNLNLPVLAALGSTLLFRNKPKHTKSSQHNLEGFHCTIQAFHEHYNNSTSRTCHFNSSWERYRIKELAFSGHYQLLSFQVESNI